MAAVTEDHLLSLKVMRLSRPSFVATSQMFYFEPSFNNDQDVLTSALEAATLNDLSVMAPYPAVSLDTPSSETSTTSPSGHQTSQIRIRDVGSSDLLSLPSAFGSIHLGETFISYLCVNNESPTTVHDVGIKAELQTASQRFTLADTVAINVNTSNAGLNSVGATSMNSNPSLSSGTGTVSNSTMFATRMGGASPPTSPGTPARVSLLPTQSAEFIIQHEIKELGVHILVCSVHYIAGTERKYFRKFYKFQVLNPLAVKTKVNTLHDGSVFLEAQVQNVSSGVMCLERMNFESNELFQFNDLNHSNTGGKKAASDLTSNGSSNSGTSRPHPSPTRAHQRERSRRILDPSSIINTDINTVFEDAPYLAPQDTRQYLYMLTPKTANDPLARTTSTLGKLDIMWRTAMGQVGRLQTSQLSRKVPPVEPYDISVIKLPPMIKAEHPFTLLCKLRNNLAGETLRLSVSAVKSRMGSVLVCGMSEMMVGDVGPLDSVDFELHFFPLLAGLHKVTGLRLNEAHSGVYDFGVPILAWMMIFMHLSMQVQDVT